MRFQFIHQHRQQWPVEIQCQALGVTRAGYYQWRRQKTSATEKKRIKIIAEIKRVHRLNRHQDYGSPRMCRVLQQNGLACSENTVAKLMRQAGVRARRAKTQRVTTTDSRHELPIAPNRLQQDFTSDTPNRVWLTDITYVPTAEGFTYLCTVQDLCSRRIVGWATSRHIDTALVLAALNQALALRNPAAGLIVHSDRGSQFASLAYRQRLQDCQALQSMSRKGNCYDNAPMESFFKSYKVEEVYHQRYGTHEEATRAVVDYIERFYNSVRLHSSLGYQTPQSFETQLLRQQVQGD